MAWTLNAIFESFIGQLTDPIGSRRRQSFFRYYLAFSGSVYLIWYFVVQSTEPSAVNPLPSRLVICAGFYLAFALSFWSDYVHQRVEALVYILSAALTAHYLYLVHLNQMRATWQVGFFITIVAIGPCYFSPHAHSLYSALILVGSVVVSLLNGDLAGYFLPGVVTFVVISNLTMALRTRILAELSESVQGFQGLLNATFEGIVVHDNGKILEANQSFAQIFGWKREDLIGQNVELLLTAEGFQTADAMIKAGNHSTYLCRAKKKSGQPFYLEVAGKKHLYKGRVARIAAVQDVSARIEAEAERLRLIRAESAQTAAEYSEKRSAFLARVSRILSSSFEPKDFLQEFADDSIRDFSTCTVVALYASETEKTPRQIVAHRDSDRHERASLLVERILRGAYPETPLKWTLTEKQSRLANSPLAEESDADFQYLAFRSYIALPLLTRDKSFGYLLLFSDDHPFNNSDFEMARDIVDRIALALDNTQLFQSAQSAIRLRDEFISVASHELKTPLTPLKLQNEVLHRLLERDELALIPKQKLDQMLNISQNQINRLSNLVEELLDVSRINAGHFTLKFDEFDLGDVVEEILEIFALEIQKSKSPIQFTAEGSLIVHWDRTRTEQIMINLLRNALSYGAGKSIEIKLRGENDQIILSIRDHGIGISKDDKQRIFGRFERAVSHKNYGGLGLGLYILHQIVKAHHGKVELESALNEGSEFTVRIPRRPDQILADSPGEGVPL